MEACFKDVSKVLRQALDNLNPDGWIEWSGFEMAVRSDDNTFPPNSAYLRLIHLLNQASEKFGKPMNIMPGLKSLMQSIGFTNVSEKRIKVILHSYPCRPTPGLIWFLGSAIIMAQRPQNEGVGEMGSIIDLGLPPALYHQIVHQYPWYAACGGGVTDCRLQERSHGSKHSYVWYSVSVFS